MHEVLGKGSLWGPGEGDPADLFSENQPRGGQQLGKVGHLDPFLFVPLELDPGLRQHVDGVLRIHVLTADSVCVCVCNREGMVERNCQSVCTKKTN